MDSSPWWESMDAMQTKQRTGSRTDVEHRRQPQSILCLSSRRCHCRVNPATWRGSAGWRCLLIFLLFFSGTYPACGPSAQRSQRRSCAPAPRASCPPCLQMSESEACAGESESMRKSWCRGEGADAMLRRAIGGVVAGGFCRNFYKSDSSLQRSTCVARFWPGSCTVAATLPATASARTDSQTLQSASRRLHNRSIAFCLANLTSNPIRLAGLAIEPASRSGSRRRSRSGEEERQERHAGDVGARHSYGPGPAPAQEEGRHARRSRAPLEAPQPAQHR